MWFKSREDVDVLIAKGKYSQAARLLRAELEKDPSNTRLRGQLGDVLGRANRPEEAVTVLAPLVHELAEQGFSSKAIAVVKKIQRLDPSRDDIDRLIEKVRRQAEEPEGESPQLIRGYVGSAIDAGSTIPTTASPAKREIPTATSKVESNWMDQAASRSDFHWSPILSRLSSFDLRSTIGRLRLLTKHSGSIIYGQGDPATSLFVLATGFARAFERDDGPYRQVAVFEEGQFFGEEAFFAPHNGRLTTVTAAHDCELLELDLETLREILREDHGAMEQLEGVHRERPWSSREVW